MRIALAHDLPSGGALRIVADWAKRLRERHEIDLYVLSTSEREFAGLEEAVARTRVFESPKPIRMARLAPLAFALGWRGLTRVYRAMAAEIDRGDYDVVFVQPGRLCQSPPLLSSLRTPAVYFCHDPARSLFEGPTPVDRRDRLARAIARRVERRAAGAAQRVLVNSRFNAANIRRYYSIDPIVVRLGVDSTRFRLDADREPAALVSVGAIAPEKGFDFLIDALALLAPPRPPLVLVGDRVADGEPARLRRLAEAAGVEIEIRVRVTDLELVSILQRSLVFLYAPIDEPLGLAPLEAMACGRPVLAVAEGGVVETVGEVGLLVARDRREFAARLRELLDRPGLRAELGARGRDHVVGEWSLDRSAVEIERHLTETAAIGRSP